jgi:hypothetical protein
MKDTTKLNNIRNKRDLIAYLEEENNSYSSFILEKIQRDPSTLDTTNTQKHHIIPTHRGGPDEEWNLVCLSVEEHGLAHELLYNNYQFEQDLGASQLISVLRKAFFLL